MAGVTHTPAYVGDEKKLIENCEILKSVQEHTGCKILLAQKAFSMFCEYPLIGNYGVPQEGADEKGISRNFESERIWVRGLVISDYSFDYSHWDAVKSLDEWLKEQKIPGIFGVDTRALTQLLRERGSDRKSVV